MGGKTSTSTSSVQVPADVLARYNSVNKTAETAASQPFQSYSSDPNAFVAPLSDTQQAGIQNTNNSASQAQPYYQAATGLVGAGTSAVNPTQIGDSQINQFMNPYLKDVVGGVSGVLNQNNQQAMAGQLGNAISSGAFGGDRSGIAAANLSQQQTLANANIYSGLFDQGYNNALGAAQQQQGVNLGAQEANRAANQWGSGQLANLGAGAQSAALQGATAQLTAGQQEQSTQQAGLTSLYNQFLQQQAYPFQTAQFLANIAEGTGSLSGSTTSTTQPTGLFGNLLSDRRAKEDIREVGKAKNGLKVYTFKYKGDPEKVTHLGFMADEVEKKHPEAVGLAGGLKTVDYERAARADGGGLVFDPNAGEYGLGAAGTPGRSTYVPAPTQGHPRTIAFQHTPPAPRSTGLTDVADQYKAAKGLYNDGSELWKDGKSVVSGLGGGNLSRGGLALARDDGGIINDAYSHETTDDLLRKQAALHAEAMQHDHAPNSAGNGPVSGALAAQNSQPKYSLGSTPDHSGHSSGSGGGLGDLAALGTMASDVAPYALAMFGLKAGGLVPPEHHADGDVVGDTLNSDEFGRPLGDVAPDAPDMGGLKGRGLPPGGGPKFNEAPASGLAPVQTKPYRQRPVYAEDAAPMPPERPVGLGGATPAAVAAQPGLAAPASPTFHYQPDGRLGPRRIADQSEPSPALASLGASPDRAMTALASSPWRAPAYSGARPETAPNPANYGTDQNGQAAFIRDYAAYRGVDPKFALGVANAEGLRAISPHNPNGASSVDIDPATGKPFSFGAFQLNVRNGLGNVAMANGIDPTKPEHANLANKFALDQMAEGGLKPWRGDAAVTAYQHGQGTVADNSGQPQQSGLMGSLGSFLHGQPDGQSSPNGGQGERALMAVLSGLGAVGSYKGQSPLGAILQGLGAGAHGWMDSGKQQADIANTQAHTGLVGAETGRTNVGAARESIIPEYGYVLGPDGNLHVVDKRIGTPTGVPLMGGVPSAANKAAAPAPGLAPSPAAPVASPAPSGPDLTGVGYDKDSAAKASGEILAGPQASHDIGQSSEYQDSARKAAMNAQEAATYTRPLASSLAHAYQQGGWGAPGAGFTGRAGVVNTLNTTARSLGFGERYFGDADAGSALANKINTLQGAMRAQGASEHSLGALEMFKGANATLDQPPEASAEIAAHLMTDQMRAQDRYKHAQQWKADSPTGTVLGAQDDFTSKNGPQKYDRETARLRDLMLHQGKFFENLTSGLPAKEVVRRLQKRGLDPALARYFVSGQS